MAVIDVVNLKDGETVNHQLLLLKGFINGADELPWIVCSCVGAETRFPVHKGTFKCLAHLSSSENDIILQYGDARLFLRINYKPRNTTLRVTPVYIICDGDSGEFQGPAATDKTISSAQERILLGAKLAQCIFAEKLIEKGFGRKTFQLESDLEPSSGCIVFRSQLNANKARAMAQEEIWEHLARELMASEIGSDERKFLAFLSCTYYDGQKLHGDAALSCGGLALLGSACLHTWPRRVEDIAECFNNTSRLGPGLLDNSCYRGTYGGCFSTTLGSACHEVGHMFNLGHPEIGIMSRGFDYVDRVFIAKGKESLPYINQKGNKNYTFEVSKIFEPTMIEGDTRSERNANQKTLPLTKHSSEPFHSFDDDLTFWSPGCAAILAYHRWFNDSAPETKIKFDISRGILSSDVPLRVVQLRGDCGVVKKSWIMCESQTRQLVLPRASLPSHTLLAVDNNGSIFTTCLD